jgi:predicted TIM-barrel fold metal-dependent hydrolase
MSLASLIANGVFERYPRLKFVFTEVGFAWLPEVIWVMDAYWRAAREETPWVSRPPSAYVFENVRFTTQPFIAPQDESHTAAMLDMIRAERTLMFSSDYPHWDYDPPEKIISLIPQSIRRRVMVENALELYGSRLA